LPNLPKLLHKHCFLKCIGTFPKFQGQKVCASIEKGAALHDFTSVLNLPCKKNLHISITCNKNKLKPFFEHQSET
jgi:hypothetical protein